jgi:tetratricopeptide (TPR) repeat protein
MKKLILSIAIVSSAFVFAQKEDTNAKLQSANKAAMDAYNAKNYAVAGPKFLEVYNLLKTAGQDEKIYMYYAGLNYALANNSEDAIKIYTDLINSGFTGVQTTYTAKDKKTGQPTSFDKNTWEMLKKSSDYSDFKTEQTPSVEQDMYETLSTVLLNAKKNEEAIAIIEKGLAKYPNNAKLKESLGTAYYQSGNNDKFMTNLKEQLAKNPNDATNWYNLGVLQSKDPAMTADAEISFKKAIELKSDFSNAYQNLVLTTIGDDSKAGEEINSLRKTKPDEATKLIDTRKERFNKALPYAEKWYQAVPNDINAVSTLRDIYNVTKNQAKAAEMKAKEAELNAKAKQ